MTRSRSTSISSAASAATCSSPRWSMRCRCSRRRMHGRARGDAPSRRSRRPNSPQPRAAACARAASACAGADVSVRPLPIARSAGAHAMTLGTRMRRSPPDRRRAAVRADTRACARACSRFLPTPKRTCTASPIDQVHFHELARLGFAAGRRGGGLHRGASSTARAGRRRRCRWAAGRCAPRTACCRCRRPRRARCSTGYPWHDDGIAGERVTPTGAAILRHLVFAGATAAARREPGACVSVGSGAGTRTLPGTAKHPARAGVRARYRGHRR